MPEKSSLIIDRLHTRESSSLAFAAVAASSSLVVLALKMQVPRYDWMNWVGLSFAVLGVFYREATMWSVDTIETQESYDSYPIELRKKRDVPLQQAATLFRRTTIRFFLLLPIVAWLAFISPTVEHCILPIATVFLLAFALLPSIPVSEIEIDT